jgi:hypothetical protein
MSESSMPNRPEIKREMLLCAYAGGEISLGKAAELMGVSSHWRAGGRYSTIGPSFRFHPPRST